MTSTRVSSSSSSRPHSSYPKPEHPIHREPTAPRPARLPYLPPPGPAPPRLPSRPTLPVPQGWQCTHHAVPASFPRRYADSFGSLKREDRPHALSSLTSPTNREETREERTARNEGEVREWMLRKYDAVEGTGGAAEKGLWMAAERWCRTAADERTGEADGGGITLVMTHANGLHKEMWHPTLHRLLTSGIPDDGCFGQQIQLKTKETGTKPRIDEIWLFDDIHHGASIDLNAGRIGPVHSWSDGGRDIVNFLQHVWRSESAGESSAYPDVALDWRESGAGEGLSSRKVIGVGHSFGGNALVQAAAESPDLFHALFLVDPMCPSWAPPRSSLAISEIRRWWPLATGAIKRRTAWPSMKEAEKLRRSPFFGSWHDEVWKIFLSHGLVPLPSTNAEAGERGVQLATPSWAEAAVFAESTGLAEGWDRLLDIPPEVAVGFLMANEPKATMGEKMTREMVWRAPNSVNEIVPDAGHLAVQERPDRVADALGRFISGLTLLDDETDIARAKL